MYKWSEIYITPLEEKLIEAGHSRKLLFLDGLLNEQGELLGDLYELTYGQKEIKVFDQLKFTKN